MVMIAKLLEIASASLSTQSPALITGCHELSELLTKRNGFFAFENALLVLPATGSDEIPGIGEWNSVTGWRQYYPASPPGTVFFAMDAFSSQFGIAEDGAVERLNPETGETEHHAQGLSDWATRILARYDFETGWSVARDWQIRNRPLRPGQRLLPKKPFVMGGEYEADNLVAVPCREAMAKLGQLATQVREVPDGTILTIHGWNP
ncbi:MAG: SMI1/KNR4 family protein [Deltaproteobacteria bacterium]|nr:SMI1/KNR4 family protein [Deltaproteobacteria bacterium]